MLGEGEPRSINRNREKTGATASGRTQRDPRNAKMGGTTCDRTVIEIFKGELYPCLTHQKGASMGGGPFPHMKGLLMIQAIAVI